MQTLLSQKARGSTVDGTSSCVNTRALVEVTVVCQLLPKRIVRCYPETPRSTTDSRQKCNLLYQRRNESFCRAIRVRVDGRTSARRTIILSFTAVIHSIHRRVGVDDAPTHRSSPRNETTLDDDKNEMTRNTHVRTPDVWTSAHAHGIIHPSIHRFPRCIFDTLQVRLSTTEHSRRHMPCEPTPTTDDDRQ